MSEKKITIESIEMSGPVSNEYTLADAVPILNNHLDNKKIICINNVPWNGEFIEEGDLKKAKLITVINELVGG